MEPETAPTHEEIWDDSALVDSWNEALEEYKVSQAQFQTCDDRVLTISEIPQHPRQRRHSRRSRNCRRKQVRPRHIKRLSIKKFIGRG